MTKTIIQALMLCTPLALMGCQLNNDVAMPNREPTTITKSLADELYEYDWRLVASDDDRFKLFIETRSVYLTAAEDRLSFGVGCNVHSAGFTLTKDILTISDGVAATRKACDPSAHEAERVLAASFTNAKLTLKVQDDRQAVMTHTNQGKSWTWQGVKKPDVLYGEPVVLYWEIEPEPILCANNAPNCLKVRNVRYDDQGIKMGAGAWREFDDVIEGYHHETGVSKIIRLKAYTDKSTGETVHVYDSTVEYGLDDR
ncbi:META domain-containing protein, partial [Moraxella sp.]|uniref:META domain-containing protein n=1 Tax=Moraxella sp. TaxID=479 RepID=UPI00261EDA17